MSNQANGLSLLLAFLLSIACGGDKDGSADASSGVSAGTDPGTDSVSSSPTTGPDEGPTGTSEPTTVGDPSLGTTTPTSEVTSDSTEPPLDVTAACDAQCQQWVACGFELDAELCTSHCIDDLSIFGPACIDAFGARVECLITLDCRELGAALETGEEGVCGRTKGAFDTACPKHCGASIGGGPGDCSYEVYCPGELQKKMHCDDDTCACLFGEKQFAECSPENGCDPEKAVECCGFQL